MAAGGVPLDCEHPLPSREKQAASAGDLSSNLRFPWRQPASLRCTRAGAWLVERSLFFFYFSWELGCVTQCMLSKVPVVPSRSGCAAPAPAGAPRPRRDEVSPRSSGLLAAFPFAVAVAILFNSSII